jgi:hypothetical protein
MSGTGAVRGAYVSGVAQVPDGLHACCSHACLRRPEILTLRVGHRKKPAMKTHKDTDTTSCHGRRHP